MAQHLGDIHGAFEQILLTPAVKAKVKSAVEAGKAGSAIAKEMGISVASVNVLKKALGLTKARK